MSNHNKSKGKFNNKKHEFNQDIMEENFVFYNKVLATKHKDTVINSATKTVHYTDRSQFKFDDSDTKYTTEIKVVYQDCIDAAIEVLVNNGDVTVLNMASDYKPGGGYLKGSSAQEEDLCRRTSLYIPLANEYNLDTKRKWRYPLHEYSTIYTPDVIVFRDNKYNILDFKDRVHINVISAAALRNPKLVGGRLTPENEAVMITKIRVLLNVALANKQHSLILSAWGCGAFHNPPSHIAELFKKVIDSEYKDKFKTIVFAILGPQENFNEFDKVFSNGSN